MDFVQTFVLDESVCELIVGNLNVDGCKEKTCIEADIPEIKDHVYNFAREYFTRIEEFNYFGYISKMVYEIKDTIIRYIPPWRYQHYESPVPGTLSFFIFLKENDSVFEVFNPFVRGCFRIRPYRGLVVMFPAIWMMVFRHTDTFTKDSIFISGTLDVDHLDNMKQP